MISLLGSNVYIYEIIAKLTKRLQLDHIEDLSLLFISKFNYELSGQACVTVSKDVQ